MSWQELRAELGRAAYPDGCNALKVWLAASDVGLTDKQRWVLHCILDNRLVAVPQSIARDYTSVAAGLDSFHPHLAGNSIFKIVSRAPGGGGGDVVE